MRTGVFRGAAGGIHILDLPLLPVFVQQLIAGQLEPVDEVATTYAATLTDVDERLKPVRERMTP